MSTDIDLPHRLAARFDLPAYLAANGFRVDPEASNTDRLVMSNRRSLDTPLGEIQHLHLRRDPVNGWSYVNRDDHSDRGDVLDYLRSRGGYDHRAAGDFLYRCMTPDGRHDPESIFARYQAALANKPRPLTYHEQRHVTAAQAPHERNLALQLLKPSGVTFDPATEDRAGGIRRPSHALEILENPRKLWVSKLEPTDKRLVITERPIDGLAHRQLTGAKDTFYVAVGDVLTPTTRNELRHVLAAMPPTMSVVVAVSNSPRGQGLAADITQTVCQANPLARARGVERATPETGARWSEQLQYQLRHQRQIGSKPGRELQR